MRIRTLTLSILVAITFTLAGRSAFAQSASAFKPLTSSDAPYIQHAGWGVYNSDTSPHTIAAGYTVVTTTGATEWNLQFSAYDNGGTLSCTAYAILLSGSFPVTPGTPGSYATVGLLTGQFSVSVSTPGTYAVSMACVLPGSNSNGSGTIFGVTPFATL